MRCLYCIESCIVSNCIVSNNSHYCSQVGPKCLHQCTIIVVYSLQRETERTINAKAVSFRVLQLSVHNHRIYLGIGTYFGGTRYQTCNLRSLTSRFTSTKRTRYQKSEPHLTRAITPPRKSATETLAIMESDSLLPVSNDVSPRKNSGSDGNGNATIGQLCRQTLATWALAVALTILAVVLLVDIPLRAMHRNDHVAASTPAATDSSTVIATSQVSASSVISSPSQRYHGTQFISFTINTLGGWGSR